MKSYIRFILSCAACFGIAAAAHSQDDVDQIVEDSLEQAENQLEQVEKQLEQVEQQMEHHMEQVERHIEQKEHELELAVSKMKNFEIDFPDIDVDIDIQDIDIPNIQLGNKLDKNFKGKTVTEKYDKEFAVGGQEELVIRSSFSTIHLTQSDSPGTLRVRSEFTVGAKTEEQAKKALEQINFSVDESDDRFEISIQMKDENVDTKDLMFLGELRIDVPASLGIEIENSFGDIHIDGLSNVIQCKNGFGSAHVANTKGRLDMSASHGGLHIKNHSGGGSVSAQFGSLTIDGWAGPAKLTSGFGNATVQGLDNDVRLDAKVSFGKAKIILPNDFAGEIKASSEFGKIKAPKGLKQESAMNKSKLEGSIGQGIGNVNVVGNFSPIDIEIR